jgi:hemerythrin-like domain-containing protein
MTEILRKLRAQHDELAKVLDVLEQEVETCRKHGRINRDILGGVLDYCRGYLTPCHHAKEDLIYRELRLAAEPAAINSIGDLVAEHEALVELTNELEAAVDNLLSDTRKRHEKFVRVAQAFLEQNRQHIRAEEDEFFHVAMGHRSLPCPSTNGSHHSPGRSLRANAWSTRAGRAQRPCS